MKAPSFFIPFKRCLKVDSFGKCLAVIALFIGLLIWVTTPLCSRAAHQPLKVGIYQNKPLVFIDINGKVKGLYIDIIKHIASKEKWNIQYVPGSWQQCLERLESGEIDTLVAIAYNKERAQKYLFTKEIVFSNWGRVYTQENLNINSILNLTEKKIAVLKNDIYYENLKKLLQSFGVRSDFVEVEDYESVFRAVQAKEAHAGIIGRLYGVQHEDEYQVDKSPIVFSPVELRFAFHMNDYKTIMHVLDKYLQDLKANRQSVYYRSLDNWIGKAPDRQFPNWTVPALISIGALFLLLLVSSIVLKSQIKVKTAEMARKNLELAAEVAERKQAEAALQESEEKYRLLVENANDAVFIAQDDVVKFPNPKTVEMTGYSAEELAKTPFSQIVHPDDRRMVMDRHKRRLNGATPPGTYSFRILNKSGQKLWVELSTVFIRWEERPATLNFLRDVSAQKKLEAQFMHAQKMEAVGILAGGIAHDFNNLLQAILGFTQLALADCSRDDPKFDHLEAIEKAGLKSAELIRQLLTFSRKIESHLRPLDLNHFVRQIKEILFRTIPKMIAIELHLDDNIKTVNADPGQIEQMLINLAVNARDAMPEGGKLIIETENVTLDRDYCRIHLGAEPGEHVLLKVTDSGHGMDKDILEHIFEPFYTTKALGEGTGLGLSTVYGIVKSHGGYITCNSEPGKGTTFKIYILVSQASLQSNDVEDIKENDVRGGTETILIVDDEESLRTLGEQILKRSGYTVLTASNGEDALALYVQKKDQIDLVLLDLIMPGIDGRRCLEEILQINPAAKVAIASGYSINSPSRKAALDRAKGFINKPFGVKEMLKIVREILDN